MGLRERLMLLLHFLRNPATKPPAIDELDRRLDDVDRRLRVLSPERARRARDLVRQRG